MWHVYLHGISKYSILYYRSNSGREETKRTVFTKFVNYKSVEILIKLIYEINIVFKAQRWHLKVKLVFRE